MLGKGLGLVVARPAGRMRGVVLAGYRLIARPAVAATPPVQRKAVGRSVKAIRAVWAIWTVGPVAALPLLRRLLMRLSAGDEGGQPFDVLLALLREVLRAGLRVLRLHLRVLLLARIERLLLARRKRFAADRRLLVVAVVVAVVGKIAARLALLLKIGLALAELFLGGSNQAEVVLRVLIVVFRGDRVAGTLRVASKLKIFFGDVGRRSPNLHVRSVGLVHAR